MLPCPTFLCFPLLLFVVVIINEVFSCLLKKNVLCSGFEGKFRFHSPKGDSELTLPSESSMLWQHYSRCPSFQAVLDLTHTHNLNILLWAAFSMCWISSTPQWIAQLIPNTASSLLPLSCWPYSPVVQRHPQQCFSRQWSKRMVQGLIGSLTVQIRNFHSELHMSQSLASESQLPGSLVLCVLLTLRGISSVYRLAISPGSAARLKISHNP